MLLDLRVEGVGLELQGGLWGGETACEGGDEYCSWRGFVRRDYLN